MPLRTSWSLTLAGRHAPGYRAREGMSAHPTPPRWTTTRRPGQGGYSLQGRMRAGGAVLTGTRREISGEGEERHEQGRAGRSGEAAGTECAD